VRAIFLDTDGTLSLRDRPKPTAGDECVIRVQAAGICGTDLELLRGYAGFSGVPGHEFVGIVEDGGRTGARWVGRRVAGEITVGCGRCAGCRSAGRGHCDVRTVAGIRGRDGAFAEYLTLPADNLHAVPDRLDDFTAVFIEPTAAACRVIEQVQTSPRVCAAVVGAGRLGLLVAQILREHGTPVTVVVRGDLGASIAVSLGFATADPGSAKSLARRFDIVVDATGDPAGFATAASLLRPRGTLIVKSTFHGETPVSLAPLVVDEITVIGSRCGPFPRAIELLDAGRIQVEPLIAGVYPLEQFGEAFECARRGLKAILRIH
jgi:threonine dehydrogenase-like Zn-dependent dehydrogenase